jgi:hypothetical protein
MRSNSGLEWRALAMVTATGFLVACGGGGGGGSTGAVSLGITDAPVDFADAVVVEFTGVELKPRDGDPVAIDFPEPRRLDLRQLTGTRRAMLLDGEEVAAGEYEWLRLKVNADPDIGGDSYLRVAAGGQECELRIPSGAQTGLKLVRGFTVGAGTTTDFTIDFDLRKSVVAPPGQQTVVDTCGNQAFLLKPVLRIVDNLEVGSITGQVDPSLVSMCPSPSETPYPGNVYVFGPVAVGATVVPDDYDGVADDPNGADAIASAMVSPDTFSYTVGFLPPGDYVVAYTCALDDAAIDADAQGSSESVDFVPPSGLPATVVPGQATTIDIAPLI